MIDRAIPLADIPEVDQRGAPRVSLLPDLGAVELQSVNDDEVSILWSLDFDHDGRPYGIEYATGTDPLIADRDPHWQISPAPGGGAIFRFGFNPDALPITIWIVERSADLLQFDQIYWFSGSEQIAPGIEVNRTAEFIELIDRSQQPRAFYRLRVVLD